MLVPILCTASVVLSHNRLFEKRKMPHKTISYWFLLEGYLNQAKVRKIYPHEKQSLSLCQSKLLATNITRINECHIMYFASSLIDNV